MSKRIAFAAILVLLVPSFAGAWTPATEEKIAKRAARLAPPDMRLVIEKYNDSYVTGIKNAAAAEGARHRYIVAKKKGDLAKQLDAEIRASINLMRKQRQVGLFVEKLGTIAHLLADANNPFHVADNDPRLRELQPDFERYVEHNLYKFPTVFYGLRLNRDVPAYLNNSVVRTANFYPLLREEYFRDGQRHSSAEFDDRSTAFGVAAISYSRSVSDIINVYYYIWREAGGDVRSAAVMRKGNLIINDAAR